MDFKNRPKIKDLKKIYKYDGFFLTGDAILGNYVCMWEDKKSNKIVKSLRKRGYYVFMIKQILVVVGE